MIDKEEFEQLKKAAISSGEAVEKSAAFFSIFTKHYREDPVCLIQLSLAILLDKPICLLVPENERDSVPENMKRVARVIEHFDPKSEKSMHDATERIMNAIKEELRD